MTFLMLEKNYSEDAARNLAKVYRATFDYTGLNQAGILGDITADETDSGSGIPARAHAPRGTIEGNVISSETTAPASGTSTRHLSIPLRGSRTFDIQFPRDLTKEDFKFIVNNMKLWERQIVASE